MMASDRRVLVPHMVLLYIWHNFQKYMFLILITCLIRMKIRVYILMIKICICILLLYIINFLFIQFIVEGTVEERMMELQERKRNLMQGAFGQKQSAEQKRQARIRDIKTLFAF